MDKQANNDPQSTTQTTSDWPDVKHWREHDTRLETIYLVVAGMVKQAEIVSQEWPNRGIKMDNYILQLVASNHYEHDADEYELLQTFLNMQIV